MTGGQWWAGSDRETVEGMQWHEDSVGQVVTGDSGGHVLTGG